MNHSARSGLLFAAITALLWGFLAIAMKVAAQHVPVFTIVWFRFSFAFAALAVWFLLRHPGHLQILVKPPGLAVFAALALTANYLGYLAGLDYTTPTNAQILIQTAPLMLALVGIVVFKERLVGAQWIGVIAALVGFSLFAYDQRQGQVVAASDWLTGNGLIFGAAVAWMLYAVGAKVLGHRGVPPQKLNLFLYALPAATLWVWADFGVLAGLSWRMWLLMAFLGANTLVAYGCLGEAFKRIPAYQVSLIITLNPLITLATMAGLGTLQLDWVPDDRVGGLGYGAALLVVGGVMQVLRKAETRENATSQDADPFAQQDPLEGSGESTS